MNSSHRALREATAAAHDRVDAAFAAFDLGERDGYARFLMAHAELVWPIEAALPGARVTPDWDERKRGALLREDLALLGRRTSPVPAADTEPVAAETDAVAGILYVLEGSRLGGRFVARQLPSAFPRAYLDADQRPEKWQQLLQRIDGCLQAPAALSRAVEAAIGVFEAFERSAEKWRKVEVGD